MAESLRYHRCMPAPTTPHDVHSLAVLDQLTDVELVGLVLESFPHHERCHIHRIGPMGCNCKREEVLEAWGRIVAQVTQTKSKNG